MTPLVPGALDLDHVGRLFLLSAIRADLCSGIPVTVESWRDAYGRAADYQTVAAAKAELAGVAA